MARVHVWIPDELHAQLQERLAGLNLSGLVQDAIRAALGCRHLELACRTCGHAINRAELLDDALGRFYSDLLWELGRLVRDRGTAEGAARIAKDVGSEHRISLASRLPLPRPVRSGGR